jgi:hypothetical protein
MAIREKGARRRGGKCSPFPRVGLERGEKERYGEMKRKRGVMLVLEHSCTQIFDEEEK